MKKGAFEIKRSVGEWKGEDGTDSLGTEGADRKHNGRGIKKFDCTGVLALWQDSVVRRQHGASQL